jgi:hypothetical protein
MALLADAGGRLDEAERQRHLVARLNALLAAARVYEITPLG